MTKPFGIEVGGCMDAASHAVIGPVQITEPIKPRLSWKETTVVFKSWRKRMLAAALFGVASFASTNASAQESAYSAEQIESIIQRLEQAEAEIQSLRDTAAAEAINTPDPSVFAQGPSTALPISYLDDPTPTTADEDVLKRLAELESQWEEFDAEETKSVIDSLNNDVGGLLDDSKEWVTRGTSGATAEIFGRMHLDYWSFPSTDDGAAVLDGEGPQDRLLWRRLRFGVKGSISDQMFYKLEMEFPEPNNFEFRDMYIGWEDVPFFQTVILGNHKRPFGLDHLNSSRYNIFLSRPNVIEAFNEDTRRLGVSANGISDDLAWNWRYGVWQLERTQDDGQTFGDAYQLQAAARLANTYWYDECSGGRGYAHWAVAGAIADPDETGGPQNSNEARFRTRPEARTDERWLNTGRIADISHFDILALEHVYNYGAFQWVSELQGLWTDRDNGSDDTFFYGGYTYVAYMLTGEHMPWERETGTLGRIKPFENFFWVDKCDGCRGRGIGAWQVAFRYSYLDMNDADIFGGVANSYTTSLVWYWNPNASVQFNWVHGAIRDAAVADGAGGSGVPVDSDYDILGVRFRIDY